LANAAMGMAKLRDGKPGEALVNLERAVTANSQNYLVHYYYAYAMSHQGGSESEPISVYAPDVAANIRQELLKAIQLRPDYPESYSLLSFVSLVTGNNLDESLKLLKQAIKNSPGRNDLLLMLGQLYLRTDDYKQAQQVLEQVVKSNAKDEVRQTAQTLLTQLLAFQKQREAYEQARKSAGANLTTSERNNSRIEIVTNKDAETPQDPSAYLREALRKPEAGETQLQGTLLRLECDAKGITFVVQSGTQTLRLHAPNFEDVDITTYNPEVKGDLRCGVRKPEDLIVVCFKAQADKRLKSDGELKSMEFVPAGFKLSPSQ